ncbi:MAG: helix-turn-helix domain-containing protein [Candidatus Methanoplasma sp.]|jgi:transposase-like protein|nr:helix-turn-helix domain-containing protein [Candidatus Methanoplasma sp.]
MGKRGPKQQFADISCPNTDCIKFGIVNEGNIVGNGTYNTSTGQVRKFICKECGRVFNSRTGTAYEGIRSSDDKFDLAVRSVNDGMSIRKTAETIGCSANTVRNWVERSEEYGDAFGSGLEKDLMSLGVPFEEITDTVEKTIRHTVEWALYTLEKGLQVRDLVLNPELLSSHTDTDQQKKESKNTEIR